MRGKILMEIEIIRKYRLILKLFWNGEGLFKSDIKGGYYIGKDG